MARALATYVAKRDPARTPEPMPTRRRREARPPVFVIQEHHARALHWDFRLERDGVLVSWALPKGLPVDPKRNHLAVHTEDHPLEYQDFEGDIPKGEYGGGNVRVWDRGTYELEKWRDDEVMVVLHGARASGRYVLFPTGKPEDKNWMIHRMDPPAEGFEPMPERIRPMLALTGELPARRTGWAYEFKWDGVRAIAFVEGGRVRALSRNDKPMEDAFPELREVGEILGARSAVIDGELVVFDEEGRPSFGRLQQRLHLSSGPVVARRAREYPASYLVFDVLYLEGRSTLALPYDERRRLLEGLHLEGARVATPPAFTNVAGSDLLRVSRERGLEGLVVKRRDSPYAPGQRNGAWIKVKNFRTQEVVVGGFTEGKGARSGSLGALLVGLPAEAGRLVYAGKVGTGFSASDRAELLRRLGTIARSDSPFTQALPRAEAATTHFVAPVLVAEVQYGEWTADGRLRHPSWRGLRPDKEPGEVVRED